MSILRFLSHRSSTRRASKRRVHQTGLQRRRSILETLEDRRVLASFAVITSADTGNGSLREAIASANASLGPDVITFAPSVTGTITLGAINGPLSITDSVSIAGPGSGALTIRANTNATNEFRIFDVQPGSGDVSIAGLTLSGGRVTGQAGGAIRYQSVGTLTVQDSVLSGNVANNGGAIYGEYDGTIAVINSTFENNEAKYGGGGAIHAIETDITVQDSTFNNNRSYGSGGAISSFSLGSISITNSQLTNNQVTEAGFNGGAIDSGDGAVTIANSVISGNTVAGGDGGGLYSINGAVTITSSTFDGNIANYNGGAILNDVGPLTITDSMITNNRAQYGDGGGISNFVGNLTLTRSTVSANNSVTDGGGVSNVSGIVVVRDSTIDNNTSGGDGGGLATITGAVALINSTVSTNTANVRGGGIQTDNAPVRLVNSTLVENTSNISGGGIGTLNDGIFVGDNSASILIHNTIVAANTSPIGPDFVSPSTPVTNLEVRNSLIGNNKDTSLSASNGTSNGNYVGTPTALINPSLGPLSSNGGTTRTHNPGPSSLAVDHGSNALALDLGPDARPGGGDDTSLVGDQRGGLFARIANAGGGGSTVDIGAIERQARPILTVDSSADESDGNLAPGDRTLRELIELANASDGFDTIIIPASIGSTITLDPALGPLLISDTVSIIGPGADLVALVAADGESQRLVQITSTAGNVTVSGLRMSGGNAGLGGGGAIQSLSPGDLVVTNVELSDNAAAIGGAIQASAGTVSIASSLLANNTSTAGGGAVATSGTATLIAVVNSTFSANAAGTDGGAIFAGAGAVSIASSTITANSATAIGGAIAMGTSSTTLRITNSIVASNTAATSPEFSDPTTPATNRTVEFSLIGSSAGTTLVATTGSNDPDASGNFIGGTAGSELDPLLQPLALAGGRLRSHVPMTGSLAIDNGSTIRLPVDTYDVNGNGSRTETLPTDVRTAPRAVDAVDIGSVELAPLPSVTWSAIADISFGTPLDTTQLNAVSTAAGSFVYSPVAGTVLDAGDGQTLTATFTPNNPLAFRSVVATNSINVNTADPMINWNDPSTIVFGTALTETQLNAMSNVTGTFVYTPVIDTVLDAGDDQVLSVQFTPDDPNYNAVTSTVMIDVQKATATITWNDPDDILAGTPLSAAQLNATADLAGTFVYTPPLGTILATGLDQTLTAEFTPDDATNYGVTTATVMINVIQANSDDYGDAPSDYPVTLSDDGARHAVGSLRLGSTITQDTDGQPSANADADSDDGVVLIADPVASASAATTASFSVTASAAGKLDAWLDFGADGSWDAADQIADSIDLVAGTNVLSFTIPAGKQADVTFARFRLSSAGGLSPTGFANNGEVEDYLVEIFEGDATADIIVTPPSGSTIVESVGGEVIVRAGDIVLFRASASELASLQVSGGNDDDSIELNTIGLASGSTLVVEGGQGTNTLVVQTATLDLTDTASIAAEDFAVIDLSSPNAQTVTINTATVSALSPSDRSILVRGDGSLDRFVFADAAEWRLGAPELIDGEFMLVAVQQSSGEIVRSTMSTGWHNFIEPSDVNNSGGVTASDALVIINELGRRSFSTAPSGDLDDPASLDVFPGTYYDQNADGRATALDALRVINQLARIRNGGPGLEQIVGEQIAGIAIERRTTTVPDAVSAAEVPATEVPQRTATQSFTSPTVVAKTQPITIAEAATESSDWETQVDQTLAQWSPDWLQ
ncbi:hypothetical protein Poly51_46350 [Rubripirellula tenax]|uniref:GEVED domain-containing protein n=1 Tax=Rubripirellula tenax TaxID=2528015 RepID=A0A5C6EG30_9BACT|nr:choice-of-anchor Q domain-containing protein [Rubripirellula tenax]TWU48733.1 hypothetical protein Poly51_46350 [Rubripirellula tenax]